MSLSRAPLRYHQPITIAHRVMLGLGAMIPFFGFYDLLIRPGVPWLRWGMAPFFAMGLIALGFGSIFLGVAIFGGARTVTIDRGARACYVDFEWAFGLHRRFTHPFSELGAPRTVEQAGMDGPSRWGVEMARRNKRAIRVETFAEEADAQAAAAAIAAYMAGR